MSQPEVSNLDLSESHSMPLAKLVSQVFNNATPEEKINPPILFKRIRALCIQSGIEPVPKATELLFLLDQVSVLERMDNKTK